MTELRPDPVRVTAPNGVVWTRRPGCTSTGAEFLIALEEFSTLRDVSTVWSWWQDGREQHEHDRVMKALEQWDNNAPERPIAEFEAEFNSRFDKQREQEKRRRAELAAQYDKDRDDLRLRLLRTESDAAFFAHVLEKPASPGQREDAERRLATARSAAEEMRQRVGDPEQVIDKNGYLPAGRRARNLDEHMHYFRHRMLREWATTDKRRFNALLKMPMPDPSAMCSECQAPTQWHEYDISLRLFHPQPSPGSQAETLNRLMPGWWDRCPACTAYRIRHVWGGEHAIPDFTGEQWSAMLPQLLRTLFTPANSVPKPKSAQPSKATIKRRLREIEDEAERLRAQLEDG
jgi:hypothetical protein